MGRVNALKSGTHWTARRHWRAIEDRRWQGGQGLGVPASGRRGGRAVWGVKFPRSSRLFSQVRFRIWEPNRRPKTWMACYLSSAQGVRFYCKPVTLVRRLWNGRKASRVGAI